MFQCLTALRVFCFSGRTACPLIFADLTGLQKPQKTDVAARISRGYPPPVSRWDAVRHWKGRTKNKRRCNVIFGDLRPLRCFRRKRTSSQRERPWQSDDTWQKTDSSHPSVNPRLTPSLKRDGWGLGTETSKQIGK